MFFYLGAAEVIALLAVGAFIAPMFIAPTHRGGSLLLARHVEIHYDRWPAVLIMAAHAGLAAWLLTLINRAPLMSLEAGPIFLKYNRGGVFRSPNGSIPLEDVDEASAQPWHPQYHIAAMAAVGFPMLIYAMVGRLTLRGFGEGLALVALCCVLAAAQSTNNLVIRVKGTKKPYVFAFSTISLNRKYPAVTHAQLNAVAGRINDLAMEARTQASTRRSAHSEFPPPSPNSDGVGLHAAAFECADSR